MTKTSPKTSSPLGKLHQDSIRRNDYTKSGPAPAKGFPSSMGSTGPVTIMRDGKEPKGK